MNDDLIDYPEDDLVDGFMVQRPQDEIVNIPGKAQAPVTQLRFLDLPVEQELGWVSVVDDDDRIGADAVDAVNQANAVNVPYNWQWWLHDARTLPPVDESNPPATPSGWVDPVTGQYVP